MIHLRRCLLSALVIIVCFTGPLRAGDDELLEQARSLFDRIDYSKRTAALTFFRERKNLDSVGALILALRFVPDPSEIGAVLAEITGEDFGASWNDWMVWQEKNPQIKPFKGFEQIHAEVHRRIDGNFQLFLGGDREYRIRVEEITWGGVVKDGIPALTNPEFTSVQEAEYMEPQNLVFGVRINGDARAYPLRILNWHEMFNDTVGGVPVSLAYCTLCGSGILFETQLKGYPHPLILGSSGFLYRSNKLMYDTYTHSLWNQFTGEPVVGPLAGSGIQLKVRPVVITSWERWVKENPETTVLSIDTGYSRDYGTGVAYRDYFASNELMFPAAVDETDFRAKDYIFSLRGSPIQKAWPLALFEGGQVINDSAGNLALVLIGNSKTRTVRAFESGGIEFTGSGDPDTVRGDGQDWSVTEEGLRSADGRVLARLPGHVGFWFAWQNYYGKQGEIRLER